MDAIPAISFDLVTQGVSGGGGAAASQASSQVSVHDVSRFEALHRAAGERTAQEAGALEHGRGPDGFASVLKSLQSLNGKGATLADAANELSSNRQELTPGDMVQLTVRCHEFMFQCELTSNVANRSSEGVQQLFRQQG